MISRTDWSWLNRALDEAERATSPHRLGAVIVRGGSLLSAGHNHYRNNPKNAETNWSIHAEQMAIRRAGGVAQRATLYVARITGGGNVGLAAPCAVCLSELFYAGITKVCHTTDTGAVRWRVNEGVMPLSKRASYSLA